MKRAEKLFVVVVAGGIGTRMGAALPKQFLPLRGKPVVQWSLECFDALDFVADLILVLPRDWLEDGRKRLSDFSPRKTFQIVPGGLIRQDSVQAGLDAITKDRGWVAIHDGARPAISAHIVGNAFDEALKFDSAVCAIPATDTLVQARDYMISGDVPRTDVFQIQTPQIFRLEILRQALENARLAKIEGTDDSGLVRKLGMSVHLVPGSRNNVKITCLEDLALLEGETLKSFGEN